MKYSSLAASACLAHGCQQRFQCRVTMALLSVVGPDPPPAGFWARDRHTRSARCCAPRSQPSGGPSDWLLPAPVALLSGAGKGQRAPRPRVAVPSVRLASSASAPNLPYLGQRASILIQLVYGEEVNPAPGVSSPVPAKGGTCEFIPVVVFAL